MSFTLRPTSLPDFPWDTLAPYGEVARRHADGLIDLSVGTPVDSVPEVIQQALAKSTNTPGYPTAQGQLELRSAFVAWIWRNHLVSGLTAEGVLPTIGSKEFIAWLPTFLQLDARDVVAIPATAYPTYDVGARLAGCKVVTADGVDQLEAARVTAEAAGRELRLVWLNSPSNPTGQVLTLEQLRAIVEWGRKHSILIASDECYIDLGWKAQPLSILHPEVSGGNFDSLLAVHSLSKRSNLAGYRAGFVAGDARILAAILAIRKHSGLMAPSPIQQAAIAALNDDLHAAEQKHRYGKRRALALEALSSAGFQIDHSEAGLYLWATRGEDCWQTVSWLAERGVLVAPGSFYGAAGNQHVRVALTAPDAAFAALSARLG